MPQFNFRAKSIDGKETKGVRDAESEYQLARMLRQEGYVLVKADAEGASRKWRFSFSRRAGLKEKIFFCKNLQVMVSAGVSLPRAVGILADQSDNKSFSKILIQLKDDLIKGNSFSAALSGYPEVFSDFFCSMAKVGEETGTLANVLEICAQQMEKDYALKSKIKGAMVYPVVVLVAAVGITGFLLVAVIPKFKDIFNDLLDGQSLPAITQFVMNASNAVMNNGLVVVIAIAAVVVLFKVFSKTKVGRFTLDSLKLNAPMFGSLVRKTAVSRMTRTLGTLLASGVPVLQAINIVRDTTGNEVIARAMQNVHDAVKEGESMTAPLAASKVFPPMVISMVEVGEETGALPDMLNKIADSYDDDVDNAVAAMTSIIEPVLIIFLAVVVGTIVIALFLPLVSIIGGLSG